MAGTARALGCRISCSLILIMLSMTPGCTHTSGTRNREHETAIEEQADISPKKEEYEDAPPYKEGESIGHQENRLYRAYLDGSDEKPIVLSERVREAAIVGRRDIGALIGTGILLCFLVPNEVRAAEGTLLVHMGVN